MNNTQINEAMQIEHGSLEGAYGRIGGTGEWYEIIRDCGHTLIVQAHSETNAPLVTSDIDHFVIEF